MPHTTKLYHIMTTESSLFYFLSSYLFFFETWGDKFEARDFEYIHKKVAEKLFCYFFMLNLGVQ